MYSFDILEGVVQLYDNRPDDGMISVKLDLAPEDLPSQHPEVVDVRYTSPYYTVEHGGVVAIPSNGNRVLILFKNGKYYYLSTIVERGKNSKKVFGENIYNDNTGASRVVSFCNNENSGLRIKSDYNEKKIVDNVCLRTAKGKKLILDDSPTTDCINISAQDQASIKIASVGNNELTRGQIAVETKGEITLDSHKSDISIRVQDTGNEINILNNAFPLPLYNTNTFIQKLFTGNINIVSKWADINIKSGYTGGIFINTVLGSIVINNLGQITIQGTGVDIVSNGPIQMKSDTSITLDAPAINTNSSIATNIYSNGTLGISNPSLTASINNIVPLPGANGGGPCVVFSPGIPGVPVPAVIPPNPLNISDLTVIPK